MLSQFTGAAWEFRKLLLVKGANFCALIKAKLAVQHKMYAAGDGFFKENKKR